MGGYDAQIMLMCNGGALPVAALKLTFQFAGWAEGSRASTAGPTWGVCQDLAQKPAGRKHAFGVSSCAIQFGQLSLHGTFSHVDPKNASTACGGSYESTNLSSRPRRTLVGSP